MLEFLMLMGETVDFGIAGQAMWNAPGTYTWVCPPDVTSVCVVMIGGGAHGSGGPNYNIKGGYGGGLRYCNDIVVVPGQSYTIVIAARSNTATAYYPQPVPVEAGQLLTSALGISVGLANVGTAFTDTIGGGWGCTNTYASFQYSGSSGGGSAGTYTNKTTQPSPILNGGYNLSNGYGSDLYGHGNISNGLGAGGWCRGSAESNGSVSTGAAGMNGGVRIIWGKGRYFPSSHVYDV